MHFLIFLCVTLVREASSGLEQSGREADGQSISSADVRSVISCIRSQPHAFMPCTGNIYIYLAVCVTWLVPFVLVGLIGAIMFGEILIM
jgi:hypothetical protein